MFGHDRSEVTRWLVFSFCHTSLPPFVSFILGIIEAKERALWHYSEKGSGRPLILLHGIGMSYIAWNAVLPYLCSTRRVIAKEASENKLIICAHSRAVGLCHSSAETAYADAH